MHHDELCEAAGVHQLTIAITLVERLSRQFQGKIQAIVLSYLVPAVLSASRLIERMTLNAS